MNNNLFQKELKTFGFLSIDNTNRELLNSNEFQSYIRVLYVNKGCRLVYDFTEFETKNPSLFFIGPNQHLHVKEIGQRECYFIYYNRDFYCIQLHDDEVACDGLLYNNVYNMPLVTLETEEVGFYNYLYEQMDAEFALNDISLEEMIRTYLKQIFIKAVRLWKKQNLEKELTDHNRDLEFFRKFTILVDAHYTEKHTVADYAGLMHIAPKTITNKFKKLGLQQPNEIIKKRIVLQAKRLLVHTEMSAKEISYQLGYDDPAYFTRLFTIKTGESPTGYRSKYLFKNQSK